MEVTDKIKSIIENRTDDNIELLCDALVNAVKKIDSHDHAEAVDLVEGLEGQMMYNNYLTEMEDESILSNFINQDGSKGAKWKDEEKVLSKVEALPDGHVDNVPVYNKHALFVTINMMASDFDSTLKKIAQGDEEEYFKLCYDLSIDQLTDPDRPNWIRKHFDLV